MTITTGFLKREGILLLLALAPIFYFLWIWPTVPDTVPLHWNFKGEVDNWGSKEILLGVIIGINLFIYGLMLALPHIAARKRELQAMGVKYTRIRVVLQLFITALSFAIIIMANKEDYKFSNYLLGGCFILFMVLFGNYVGSIRPNHFLGVRTPWTLQSDDVWRKTHRLTSRLLLGGAVLGVFCLLLLPDSWGMLSVALLLTGALFGPAVYSFFLFRQEEEEQQ
jgi:uncharacterized membrane protein